MVKAKYHANVRPRIITKTEHGIEGDLISTNALEVIDCLKNAGFSAELVGGCVRDLLIDRQPKDFDVATNARPEQVRPLFRRCEVFGRRFQLAQVRMKGEVIQVATYRKTPKANTRRRRSSIVSAQGKILKDNQFGNIREDAFRRDLTINALYMDPSDMHIVDYTGGYDDARNKLVRIIGNPPERYREDPVRMLRAIRFASLPTFRFEQATAQAIAPHSHLLTEVSNYRLFDELVKMLFNGRAETEIELLIQHGVFSILFPSFGWMHVGREDHDQVVDWLRLMFRETDQRVQRREHTSVPFTFAAMLWPNFKTSMLKRAKRKRLSAHRLARGMLNQQKNRTFLTANIVHRIEEVWLLQHQLETEVNRDPSRLTALDNFRAAIRLLELRSKFGEVEVAVCQRWVAFRDQMEQQSTLRRNRHRRPTRCQR